MGNPIEINASILSADFSKLGEEIKKTEAAGVDRFHIDVMDGHFVPNITMGPIIVKAIRPYTKLPLDVHLMIEHPWDYIDGFIDAGSDILGLHVECYGERRADCKEYGQWPKEIDEINVHQFMKDIKRIKDRGVKAYAVLNPGTPLCFEDVYTELDGILVMSVNPGFANQKFMPAVLPKIQNLAHHFAGEIAVDGGINGQTAPEAVKAGAQILITASYLYSAENKKEVVKDLKNLANT